MKRGRLQFASAAAFCAVALVAFGGQARADNISFASLQVSAFKLSSGGTQLTPADFSLLTVSNSSSDSATLTGFPAAGNSASGSQNVDAAMACLGNCTGISQNQMTLTGSPPPITQIFSRGDSSLNGSALDTTAFGGNANGATAQTVAEAQLKGTIAATGAGNAGTNSGFVFQTAISSVTTSFTAALSELAQNLVPGGNVQTNATDIISLIDTSTGQTLAKFTPTGASGNADLVITSAGSGEGLGGSVGADPCSLNQNAFAIFNNQKNTVSCSGDFAFTLTGLNDTTIYELQVSQQANINSSSVPEPSSLGLLAMGLLGMGFVVRRYQRNV
jgi:hypothetical protein